MLTKADLKQIREHGLTEKEVRRQIDLFQQGVPNVRIARPCTVDDGVVRVPEEQEADLIEAYNQAADEGRISKFVPSSGAATRMFRDLLALIQEKDNLTLSDLEDRARIGNGSAAFGLRFVRNLQRFAFFPHLKEAMKQDGLDLEEELEKGHVSTILDYVLFERGLNFSSLPKGLVPFHHHEGRAHTPFEEQVLEGVELVSDIDGTVRIHFTVNPEAREDVRKRLELYVQEHVGEDFDVQIDFSVQKPSTDTIAVTPENEPFRDEEGNLLFRPGGHGALLENLNELDADIVLIKNIDNVVPHPNAADHMHRKKILAGFLVRLQDRVFDMIRELEAGKVEDERLEEMRGYLEQELFVHVPEDWATMKREARAAWLLERLNRPIRVCGMVPNTGDPGGGPFWVRDGVDEFSLQIVETSQIDLSDDEQRTVFESATHFNPVDLACGLRDYRGKTFDLAKFRNPNAAFIAQKSYKGRPLKALELPGLWNGAMAHWLTVFVEVPQHTFNPVKTVNDLLKDAHRVNG